MTVHLLGTGSAHAGPDRTTTMLAVEYEAHVVLVDCGGDAVQRMLACGLDPLAVDTIILTHEHPDHISGYPLLIEKLWLMGRREALNIYGPAPTLEKARAVFAIFDTLHWQGLPERRFHPVVMEPGAPVVRLGGLTISAAPVDHPVPTIGLRFTTEAGTLVYSCDTAHSEAVVALAMGADVLIHEGTGSLSGVHSSPAEAADVAARAEVGRLVLVHAPVGASDEDLTDARAIFDETTWGQDGGQVSVGQ